MVLESALSAEARDAISDDSALLTTLTALASEVALASTEVAAADAVLACASAAIATADRAETALLTTLMALAA